VFGAYESFLEQEEHGRHAIPTTNTTSLLYFTLAFPRSRMVEGLSDKNPATAFGVSFFSRAR
jgi:hypothetical protein